MLTKGSQPRKAPKILERRIARTETMFVSFFGRTKTVTGGMSKIRHRLGEKAMMLELDPR